MSKVMLEGKKALITGSSRGIGKAISLNFGTNADYLRGYIEKNKDNIVEKVTAKSFKAEVNDLKAEDGKIFGKLSICPNKECSASLRDNLVSKLKKNKQGKCPHCDTLLTEDNVKTIVFNFIK